MEPPAAAAAPTAPRSTTPPSSSSAVTTTNSALRPELDAPLKLMQDMLQKQDAPLDLLQTRYPGSEKHQLRAVVMRQLLLTADLAEIPDALAEWNNESVQVKTEMERIAYDINEIKNDLIQRLDCYNRRRLLTYQIESDSVVLAHLPLMQEIDDFAKSVNALPEEIAEPNNVQGTKVEVEKLEAKVKDLKIKLTKFLQLCEMSMATRKGDFFIFGDQLLPPSPNTILLNFDQINSHYAKVWEIRKQKINYFFDAMLIKWHVSLMKLWSIQHQIEFYLNSNVLNIKLVFIKSELDALLHKVTQVLQEQTVNLDPIRLHALLHHETDGLQSALNTIKDLYRDSFEHFLKEFEDKNQPYPIWLREKSQVCVFSYSQHKEAMETRLLKLHQDTETKFKSYHNPIMKNWQTAANVWNAIVLKLRQLQFFIDQYNHTAEASSLIAETTNILKLMQTNIAAFESEQSKFTAETFKQRLQEFETNFNQYAANKWKAEALIENCQGESFEKVWEREKSGYMLGFSEEKTTVTSVLSKMLSEYSTRLQIQKGSLSKTWNAMDDQAKPVIEKLKSLIKTKLGRSFIDNWSKKPKTPVNASSPGKPPEPKPAASAALP